jgi:catechol 2,3-dioxygenase-like lactoylglutathione lyase family enzyme
VEVPDNWDSPCPFIFDHLAVATDKQRSASFLATLLGLPEPTVWGPFLSIHLDDGVHLDYAEPGVEFPGQHYALLVTDDIFDAALERIRTDGVPYSAGPGGPTGEINHNHGGRGVYFDDPDGHHFALITQPYFTGPTCRPIVPGRRGRPGTCLATARTLRGQGPVETAGRRCPAVDPLWDARSHREARSGAW